jgi:hypothetical protein
MAGIYRPDDSGGMDLGPLNLDGHKDHDHEAHVIAIPGDQLPDEVKEALLKALASGNGLPNGIQIVTEESEDPNPLSDEEFRQLRITLAGTAYMLLQGVQIIEDDDATLTRDEAADGLRRAMARLMERLDALTLENTENGSQGV